MKSMQRIRKAAVSAVFALAVFAGFTTIAAERVDFASRPLLAGRASLTGDGYIETRSLGVARLSPELTMPIELVYDSASEKTGVFGFANPNHAAAAICAVFPFCWGWGIGTCQVGG